MERSFGSVVCEDVPEEFSCCVPDPDGEEALELVPELDEDDGVVFELVFVFVPESVFDVPEPSGVDALLFESEPFAVTVISHVSLILPSFVAIVRTVLPVPA